MKFPHRNVSFHDVHLGHNNTNTKDIIRRLKQAITLDSMRGVDIQYWAGDFFDQPLGLQEHEVSDIHLFWIYNCQICQQLGITIRMIYGTPSHDADQSKLLAAITNTMYPDLDFRYITDMEIEYIEKFDIHVMYVPDEWASREVMYLTARKLLNDYHIDKVDFIIGHNQFGYQFIPTVRSRISTLNEEDWNDMVRYTAYFGHVHKRSQYKNIEVAGSFDRLAHGEESPKGYLEGIYLDKDTKEIIFHENKQAEIYKTISIPDDFTHADIEQMAWLHQQLDIYSFTKANIRFKYSNQDIPVKEIIEQIRSSYPHVRFTQKLVLDTNQDTVIILPSTDNQYEWIDINRENIVRLVDEQISTLPDKQPILDLLSHYVNEVS